MRPEHVEALDASYSRIKKRLGAAVALFAVFLVLTIAAALTHAMDSWGGYLIVLLAASILTLPREPVPAGVEFTKTPEGKEWLDKTANIRIYLGYARAAMFILSLAAFFGLPKVVGA